MTKLDVITFKATASLFILGPLMIVVAIACRHFGADPAIAGPAIGVASIAIMIALSWTTEKGRVAFLGHDL